MPVAKGTRAGQVPKTEGKRKPRPKVDFTPFPVVPKGKTPDSPKQAQRSTYVRAERQKKQIKEIHRIAAMGPKERARYNFGGPAGAVPASPKARKQSLNEIERLSTALKNLERLRGYDLSERGRTAGLARAAAEAERRRSSRRSSWLSDYAANLARGAGMAGEELWEKAESWKVPTVGVGSRYTPSGTSFGSVPIAAQHVGVPALKVGVPGLAKVGLEAGVGAGTLLTPMGAWRGSGEAVDMLSGLTQAVAMVNTVAKPGDPAMKRRLINEAVQGTLDDIERRYGPNTTLKEAVELGRDEPLMSTLNGIAVIAPTAKLGSIGTYMRFGATLREARILSRDPSREQEILGRTVTKPRTVRVTQEHGKSYDVEVSKSRSPIMRQVGKGYDVASRGLERAGGRRVYGVRALTPTKRGLRVEKRRLNREERRRRAAGHAMFREVQQYLKDSPEMSARLTTILKKPEGVDEDEWMKAATDDILEMLEEGRDVITPDSVTAIEQKLRNRLERFRTKMERSHHEKWVSKLEDIDAEKTRLAAQIDSHDELINDAVEVIEELEAEPKTAANRKALREQKANLETLVSRRDAWQEELDQWTIDETPVISPMRMSLERTIETLPNIDDEQGAALMQVLDARAREWGQVNDRDPGEWYGDPEGLGLSEIRRIEAGEIPEDVLAQGRTVTRRSALERETATLMARASELDQQWEKRVQTISESLFGKPSDRGKAETAKRNRERGRLARKGIQVLTVKRENFLEAEARVLRFLEEHVDDPRFSLALGEIEERARISEQLAALADRRLDELEIDEPDLTLEQRRARVEEEGFDPTNGREVYNALHRPLVEELARQEVSYAQIKKNHPITKVDEETAEANEEIREAAKAVLDKAKEDELYARILYGSDTYKAGANFPTNPARQALVASLVTKYKGRTNALPPNADTPEELGRLIALLDELTVKGRHARFWYEKSAKAIKQIAGGDKKLAAQLAQLVAIYSPQKAVIPNLGEALKAYYAWKAGLEIDNGYDWQKVEAQKVLDGTGNWEGRKTNNFYLNFLEDIDKRLYNRERKLTEAERKRAVADGRLAEGATQIGEVTADMWMARVFGYLTKNVSDGRYDVIESIVRQLAEERGWKPKQVQAAIWTAIKEISDDVSANVDFEEAISRHHGFINLEVAPGSSFTGPFKAVYDSWPDETKAAFMLAHTRMFEEFLDRAGILHRAAELGPGIFEREAAPGARLTLITSNSPVYRAPEADKQMYRFVAAAVGRATLQNAVPWLKGYIAKTKSAADLTFVNLGRRATDEEAMALYQKLNPSHDIADERVFVIHAGNQGLLLRKHPRFSAEAREQGWGAPDWPNFARGEAAHAKTFQGVVEDAIADTLPGVTNERVVHHVAEGELLENDWKNGDVDYDAEIDRAIGDRAGSPEAVRQRESADWLAGEAARLRDEFTADPDGSVERTYASLAPKRRARADVDPETARGPPEGTQPPETLSQTRQTELLGAVRFLNSEDGARILYLTEQADVSTLMHELIGHGVREMKASYPREFAAVEDYLGLPLEEWGVLEHERFAQMFERYLADGRAPTVELVPTFGKMKMWMRSIYGGIKALGKPLPIEVTSLFDTYFGAFNDANVFRIAQMMGRLPEENRLGYDQALFDFTSKELATLRRRNDARAYNKSINGLEQRVRELARKEDLTPDEEEEFAAKVAQYDILRAQREYTEADREAKLRRRYTELEKAMSKPEGRAYEGALASLRALSDEREAILRSVFGDQYDAVFANRKDLLANWLVDRGMLQADFQTGTARYVPDWPEAGKPPRQIKIPGAALASRVVGKADPRMLTLHAKNNMILWQNGNLDTDPIVVFQAWQNAQAFSFIHGVKERIWAIGRDLGIDEPIPDNVYVVNRNGTPVPAAQRAMLNAGSTHEVQTALDALEGIDTDAMDESLARYGNEILLEPKVAEALRANDELRWKLDLRVVDKEVVDALLRPLRGSSPVGTGWDIGTTIARWSLIYTNPAYIPVNLFGNFLFLSAASAAGPVGALYNMGKAARTMLRDPVLAIRIAGEAGELPAEAAISRGRSKAGRWRRTQEHEQRWLAKLTAIPDKWPRIAAWIMEAERMGYRTRDDKMRLLLAEDATTNRARDLVSERTVEAMVNFDRLSDFEKQFVTRILFVWPWIRGATAWPFYYAREFPVQTAVLANVGLTLEERREEMMGPVPLYRKNLFPISVEKGKAEVVDPGPLSPFSTARESIETVRSTVLSILGKEEQERGTMVLDYFQPLLEVAYGLVGQQNAFGQKQTTRDTILDNALSFIPMGATIQSALDSSKVSAIYDERGSRDVLRRRFARTISTDTVDLARLNAQATMRGEKTTSDKIEEERQRLIKSVTKLGGSVTLDNGVQRATVWKVAFYDAKAGLQKTLKDQRDYHPGGGRKTPVLTPLQEAWVAYRTVERYAPGMAANITTPDEIADEMLEDYTNAIIYGSKEYKVEGLLQPISDFEDEVRKLKRKQEKK